MRRLRKADPAAPADETEGSNVKPGEAPIDHEDATEGAGGESGEAEKSEDAASDAEHISHPRPEEGEEDQRGGGMGKSDDEDEDDEEEMDDAEKADNQEEEEGGLTSQAKQDRNDESLKSLTARDLEKSLNQLQRYAEKGSAETRKSVLLRKAQSGQTLSKSENTELFDLLGGKAPVKTSLAKSATSGFQGNHGIQKALDVSEYLAEHHSELTKSLGTVSGYIERSENRQHEYNLMLAKALVDIGTMVKSVAEQLDTIGNQPVRQPKSQGVASRGILQKGFGGGTPQEETLQKSQVLDAMEGILADNMQKGSNGILEGEDISTAIVKFESFNQISPNMHAAVLRHVRGK